MATRSQAKHQPCAYCGLPTPAPQAGQGDSGGSDRDLVYCCLGCRIAHSIVQTDDASDSRWAITRLGMAIFFTMNVMVFTMVLWSWNVYEVKDVGGVSAFREIFRYACMLFASPVLILLGGPLLESSFDAWRRRQFTTDVLLLLGVVASYGYSVAALLTNGPHVYFEVCCMILVAVTLGKWLEGTAKQRANQAIRSLRKLLPATVRLLGAGGETEVPIEAVGTSDRLRVLPGERIPVDGTVLSDVAVLDEQLITGESLPVSKGAGEALFAGSLNQSRELRMIATAPANEGTISRLIRAVEAATSETSQSIRLADKLAAWFVPLITIVATGAFAMHFSAGFQHALMVAVSVVLIACPCALGIATPMALWVAINSAARRGIMFRNGDAIIQLANVRSVGIDKTGTITTGAPSVVDVVFAPAVDRQQTLQLAAQLAHSSNHPLSKAIQHFVSREGLKPATSELSDVEDSPGLGVSAQLAGDQVVLGSELLADQHGLTWPDPIRATAPSQAADDFAKVFLGCDGEVKATFRLADSIRRESRAAIQALQQQGLELALLTGDTKARAGAMEAELGIRALGQLRPEDKSEELRRMPGPTAMVGDGLNDAVCLASADVGIAMDCGADVARDSADVCLLGSTMRELPTAIALARKTKQAIRLNLIWAVGYNVIGVGIAASGNLNPIVAAIAMVGSSLFVLSNSLALGMSNETGQSQNASQAAAIQPGSDLPPDQRTSPQDVELVS